MAEKPTIDEVKTMMEATTPYIIPDGAAGQAFYDMAMGAVVPVLGGQSTNIQALAAAYYIANILYLKESSGAVITAESLDDHSESYAVSDRYSSPWARLYADLISQYSGSILSGAFAGIEKNDCSDRLNLDYNRVTACRGYDR